MSDIVGLDGKPLAPAPKPMQGMDELPPAESEITAAITRILGRRIILERYRDTCIAIADHHGVQDASSDLREVEAVLSAFAWVRGEGELRV